MADQSPADFARLEKHRYLSLKTFRKTGIGVSTPVWFAGDQKKIYVWTNGRSGKVKRLRNNRGVTLAPCTYNGRVLSTEQPATADILWESDDEARTADARLAEKYGLQWRIGRFLSRTFGRHSVFLRIQP